MVVERFECIFLTSHQVQSPTTAPVTTAIYTRGTSLRYWCNSWLTLSLHATILSHSRGDIGPVSVLSAASMIFGILHLICREPSGIRGRLPELLREVGFLLFNHHCVDQFQLQPNHIREKCAKWINVNINETACNGFNAYT